HSKSNDDDNSLSPSSNNSSSTNPSINTRTQTKPGCYHQSEKIDENQIAQSSFKSSKRKHRSPISIATSIPQK
ncbi:unnamed protein product, partial [Adineta steineri]